MADELRQFVETYEDVVRFFLVIAWVDKPPVGDGGDTHLCCFGRSNAGERILNHKAFVSRDPKLLRRAQVDIGSGFAVFNFFASNNDLEKSGQLMSI